MIGAIFYLLVILNFRETQNVTGLFLLLITILTAIMGLLLSKKLSHSNSLIIVYGLLYFYTFLSSFSYLYFGITWTSDVEFSSTVNG